uniref:Uncharacterized protein n=1 Tax=Solanum tuberosum TaxID=4113 RepID=M1DIZ7_SOLTU
MTASSNLVRRITDPICSDDLVAEGAEEGCKQVLMGEAARKRMLRTRASVSSGIGKAIPEGVVENPVMDRSRARAKGRAHGVAPARGILRGSHIRVQPHTPGEQHASGIYGQMGQPLVFPTSIVDAQIALEVILTTVDQRCYERFQKMRM